MSDLISRQAAIDAIGKSLYEYEDRTEKQFQDSDELDVEDWIRHRIFVQNMSDIDRQTIMDLPSAQPEQRWIPCSERLPENYECVLTTISIPNRESKVRSGYYHNGLFSNDNGDCWNSTDPEVKGWCKLPEPYKPESEE